MRRINKTDPRSPVAVYGRTAVLLGLGFLAIGGLIVSGAAGVLPLPGRRNAPVWVIASLGLAFSAAGALLLVRGCQGLGHRERRRTAEGRFAEPWFRDHPWDSRGIRDQAGRRLFDALWGAVLCGAFLAPFNWWAFLSDVGGWMVRIIVGVFDLGLVAGIGATLHRSARFLRFGHSTLRFRRFPYHPGETLHVALSGKRLDRPRATLRYIEERYETSGGDRDDSTNLACFEHFRASQELAFSPGAPELEIVFELPPNEAWVTALSGRPVRYWELVIESEQRGVDYRTTFPLPVYARH